METRRSGLAAELNSEGKQSKVSGAHDDSHEGEERRDLLWRGLIFLLANFSSSKAQPKVRKPTHVFPHLSLPLIKGNVAPHVPFCKATQNPKLWDHRCFVYPLLTPLTELGWPLGFSCNLSSSSSPSILLVQWTGGYCRNQLQRPDASDKMLRQTWANQFLFESKPLMWDHMEGVPNIYMNLQPGLRGWLVNHFLSPMEWFGLLDRFREMLSRTWWVSTQPHRYSEKRHAAVGGTCSRCWHGWCITNPTTNTNIIQLVILTQARTPKDFKGKGKRNPTWFSDERAAESSRKHQCWE